MMNALKNASLFDLYRLNIAISHEMESSERIHQVRQSFKEGDVISYFSLHNNELLEAIVLRKNPKYVVVKNKEDNCIWNIQYGALNMKGVNADIVSDKLSKHNLKVGDCVGFNHDGIQIIGMIIRLNQKTVSIVTKDRGRWRAYYRSLFKVIDAEIINMFNAREIAQWDLEESVEQE